MNVYQKLDFQARRAEFEKEIEEIKSTHELDKGPQPPLVVDTHVKIDEKKCKLYETNDEATLDEENEEPLI